MSTHCMWRFKLCALGNNLQSPYVSMCVGIFAGVLNSRMRPRSMIITSNIDELYNNSQAYKMHKSLDHNNKYDNKLVLSEFSVGRNSGLRMWTRGSLVFGEYVLF